MGPIAHTAMLATLLAGGPDVAIHLRAPALDPPQSVQRSSPAPAPGQARARAPISYEGDTVPMSPSLLTMGPQGRKLGANTTIFVNFDGVEIDYCNPSNSHKNCSTLEDGRSFPPFSGGLAQRVAILDAMRSQLREFGVRVTAQRPPPDETYVMVVYGGEREEDEPLGLAPSGDCYDDYPNQVAFVYLDGEEKTWVNGGAATALHEASHTWGFDHIGLEGWLMAPSGDNTKANYFDGCAQIVDNVELDPVEGSCPSISLEHCGLDNFQHDVALLHLLFGQPYVDDVAPVLELVNPSDGTYYQGPADFHVELRVIDDLHPQVYEFAVGIDGLIDDPAFDTVYEPSFDVVDLPIGEWRFELRLRDEAGNETSLAFTVVVGEDAPRLDDGPNCRAGESPQGPTALLLGLALLGLVRRPGHD